ncbi:hypothetical protein [Streptomyces sp. NPDC101393]|uniref:hypothetical protein n=1 Tax=Streptomyces sp. NPDC101393 TaxID=3366141 RepID=UPI00382928FE
MNQHTDRRTPQRTDQRTNQRRNRRGLPVAAAALMAGLAIFATACSGGDTGTGSGGGSDANGKGKEADAAYKHRQCLRDHGVQVEEPKPGQDPRSMVVGGGAKTDPEKMKKAFKECGDSGPGSGSGGPSQADKDTMLKFAQCMRKNGFHMPDPKFGSDGMQPAQRIPKGQEKTFEKANKVCGGQNAG